MLLREPNDQFTPGMVEAMFEYLDALERELSVSPDAADRSRRARLGLPRYAFRGPRVTLSAFESCGAPLKFVFISSRRNEAIPPAADGGWRPAGTVDDPDACRANGLCFPNFVRQQFTLAGTEVVLARNLLPYGRYHGLVRSAEHEPQAECFEPAKLRVALRVAKALGGRSGPSDYEVWVAGEGFNTQWHFHVQFRKQRSPIWTYLANTQRYAIGQELIEEYPSRPLYIQNGDEETLLHALSREALQFRNREDRPAVGLLLAYEDEAWRGVLVRSRPTRRLFGKPLGLHEHLGEVILESESVFAEVTQNVGAASRTLENQLREWCAAS